MTRGSVVTAAGETPELPQKNATLKSDKGTLTSEEPKVENVPKRKLSSIGIQVWNTLFSFVVRDVLNPYI